MAETAASTPGLEPLDLRGRSAPILQLRPQPAPLVLRWQPWRPAPQALVAAMGMMGSIVLAADDPAALARFYGALLEVGPQPGLSPSHLLLPWPACGWLEV